MLAAASGFQGTNLDLIVIFVYFVAVLAFGLYFGAYTKSTKDFFFGGQRFAWWLIAFSCVSTTVGSYSFSKYSAMGYKYGLSSTQSYLNDWFWMPLLLLVWLPIIYYARVSSIPEYFERRFGRTARAAATAIILLYLVGYIGINLLTLGKALHALLGWKVITGAIVTSIAVGLYVFAGGQTAVIMTDLAQGIILLIAGLGLFVFGLWHLGGLGSFWDLLPVSHRYPFSEFADPPKFSFIGVFCQDGLANTGAFMLMNQGIIMRFLSLKSVKDARRMAVCWILVLAPLAAVAVSGAGWVAKAMVEGGEGSLANVDPDDAFIRLAQLLCCPGVFGFVLAAMTAALMSTADTLINATSAIFVNDIWRPYVVRDASDKHYLKVARVVSLVAAGLGIALVPLYLTQKTIYGAHAMFTAAITPPMVVAILLGALWKRYTNAAAVATLVGGMVAIFFTFNGTVADTLLGPMSFGMGAGSHKFIRALYGLIVSGVLGIAVTFVSKARPLSEIVGLVTGTQLDGMRAFKGGEVNLEEGAKVRLTVCVDETETEPDAACISADALDAMKARSGDLVYACDQRWWFGGLRSVHLRAVEPDGEPGTIVMSSAAAADAHFADGDTVVVEKIM